MYNELKENIVYFGRLAVCISLSTLAETATFICQSTELEFLFTSLTRNSVNSFLNISQLYVQV